MSRPEEPMVEVRSRADLRAWLSDNHDQAHSVWLVTWKKPSPNHLPYETLVEELLCWGWVDSQPRKVDAERSACRISPRNPTSAWSAVNKAHVARARASGAMTEAGEAAIQTALDNGMWTFLDDVERLELPPDLAAAIDKNDVTDAWEGWPRSIRRSTLEWVKRAKTAPTRTKRIDDIIRSATSGLRPTPFRR